MKKYFRELIEACAEVQQSICKIDLDGINEPYRGTGIPNSVWLMGRLINLEEVIKEAKSSIPRPSDKDIVDEVMKWFEDSPSRERKEFATTNFEQLAIYHDNLGKQIRNYFSLWAYPWDKRIVNGVDVSTEHPDAISMRIIEEVWRRVRNDA